MVTQQSGVAANKQGLSPRAREARALWRRKGGGHMVWISPLMRLTGIHLGTVAGTVKERQKYMMEEADEDVTRVT